MGWMNAVSGSSDDSEADEPAAAPADAPMSEAQRVLRGRAHVLLALALLFTVPLVLTAAWTGGEVSGLISRIEMLKGARGAASGGGDGGGGGDCESAIAGAEEGNLSNACYSWRTVRQHIIVEHFAVAFVFGAIPVALHYNGKDDWWASDRKPAVLYAASTVVIGMLECVSHVLHRTVTEVHWWWAPLKIGYITTGLLLAALPSVLAKVYATRKMDYLDFVTCFIYPFVVGQLYKAELFQGDVGSPTSFLETGIVDGFNPFAWLYVLAGYGVDAYDSVANCISTAPLICDDDGECNNLNALQCVAVSVATFLGAVVLGLVFRQHHPPLVKPLFALHVVLQGMWAFFTSDRFQAYKHEFSTFAGAMEEHLLPNGTQMCWLAHRSIQFVAVTSLLNLAAQHVAQPRGWLSPRTVKTLQRVMHFVWFHVTVTVSIFAFGMASFTPRSADKVHLFLLLQLVGLQGVFTVCLLYEQSTWRAIRDIGSWRGWRQKLGYVNFLFGTHNLLKVWLWHFQGREQDLTYAWANIGVLTVANRTFRQPHTIMHCCICLMFSAVYWGYLKLDRRIVYGLAVLHVPFIFFVVMMREQLPRDWLTREGSVALNLTAITAATLVFLRFAGGMGALPDWFPESLSGGGKRWSPSEKWRWFSIATVLFSLAAYLEPLVLPQYVLQGAMQWVPFLWNWATSARLCMGGEGGGSATHAAA